MTCLPMFTILLYGFDALYTIYLELTRTYAVFSRIAMVLFFRRNKSSRNDLEIYEDFLLNI